MRIFKRKQKIPQIKDIYTLEKWTKEMKGYLEIRKHK